MPPMERLGSYISRGVYTVSGPFHPFGGAVDIVVVEQQDGSFKSSPWYVRFGKFQGVLKAKEKVVSISVNGVDADFHMYLDHKGEAFFLREVDAEDGDSVMYPSSSSDETDSRPQGIKRPLKSKSCNFGSEKSNSIAQIDISNDKLLARTNSRRSRLLGFIFGRRSMKGNDRIQGKVDDHDISRVDSLERAEIAANLLEVKWSTNLGSARPPRKNSTIIQESSSRRDNMENILDRCKLNDEACLCSKQEGFSRSKPEFVGLGEEESKFLSCLSAPDKAVQNFVKGESFTEGKTNMITEISTVVDAAEDTEPNTNAKEVVYGSTRSDLQVASVELGTHIEEQLNGEEVSGSTTVDLPIYGISEGEFLANGVQSLVYCKKSESLMVCMDCSSDQTHELLYHTGGGCQQFHAHAEMLHATTVLLPEVTKTEDDAENIGLGMPEVDVSEFHSQQTDCFHLNASNYGTVQAKDLPTLPNPETVNLDSGLCSLKKVQSTCVGTTDEINNKENDVPGMFSYPMTSVGDGVLSSATSIISPTISEEECYLFGDFDVGQITDQREGSISLDLHKEDHFSSVDSIEKVNQLVDASHNSHSSPESYTTENQSPESSTTENQRLDLHKLRETHSPIIIPRNKVFKKEIELQTISLPNISSHSNSFGEDVHYPLSQSLDSKSKSLKWRFPDKDCSKHLKSDGDKENQLLHEEPGDNDNHSLGEFKGTVLNPPIGNPSRLDPSPGGNWGLWPFSFRRSRSGKAMLPAPSDAKSTTSGITSESARSTDADKNEQKPNQTKKKVRVRIPTSEQLACLNLKEGRNTVTFTFSTAMLGKQQVDAQIYLWKWNTRIVISDVDGTITRSDVLGQFMPMVGVDWSQTGVAHLFSAIKENGYHLLFLSARSISQAYNTRQFLLNLKQNGKVLPDGPVLISPDGLFPSLYREVIRRAPHEFKIACLEDIRALFPPDCNPFYAGFGNRDTDEISYLKIGIPKGKIFIINPKGEVAVNRCLDTKSYTSLHALVNGMFPLSNSSEQEDFNSWNFWRLPPPIIDI